VAVPARTYRFLGAAIAAAACLLMPGTASATVARSSSPSTSLDLCVVLPGFASGANVTLTTTGPSNFNESGQLSASACGSYTHVPKGSYTVTQSQTPSGFHLAQIYCFVPGAAGNGIGNVDLSSDSVNVKVNGAVSCLFAEDTGGGGSGASGGSGSSGFSPSGGSSSTSTTTKSGGTTTPTSPPGKSFCQLHPNFCVHIPFPVTQAHP
jgi:uncharacterized membrane protein YgcG